VTNPELVSYFKTMYIIVSYCSFIWAPLILMTMATRLWLEYVRMNFIKKNFSFVLLEIKIPRIIDKTPAAMELVLQTMYQSSTGTWYDRWWLGKVKPWFSLEIVSAEGVVKFFIYTPKKFRGLIESHLYAQYPDIEVHEVPDYVSLAPYMHEKEKWSIFGAEFGLSKEDFYPIKTYVDYGLDSIQIKEEQKSDPITSTIEFMGSMGRGEHFWLQILIQATGDRFHDPKKGWMWWKQRGWKDTAKDGLKKLTEKKDKEGKTVKVDQTKRQQEVVNAIERSIAKLGFDSGIRAIYLAEGEHFNGANISGLMGIMRPYGSHDLNGFKPTLNTSFDFPWQDWNGIRANKLKKKIFNAYVRRSYFFAPYKKKPYVLNTEELATIFHFPGGVAETPTFTRVEARKGEPPANLPI